MPSYMFTVTVEVERVTGKFASRVEIQEALVEAIEQGAYDAALDGIGADGESEYEVTAAFVNEAASPAKKKGAAS